jgi:tRNA threonylcarbamoyladenosine biosynthesis protein TsaB
LNLLAIETSSDWCSAALWLDGSIALREERAGQRHSELILSMIDGLLADAGAKLADLGGVAFGAGPGSFTGIRIACGVAQGLAFGAGLPVAAVSTLECIAQASGAPRVIACLDARIGEVYVVACEREAQSWRALHAPAVCRPEHAPSVPGGGWTGCGSGFLAHGEALRSRYGGQLAQVHPDIVPHAREVALLGARAFARGEGVSAEHAAPLYVRDKVALSVAERAARRAALASPTGTASR